MAAATPIDEWDDSWWEDGMSVVEYEDGASGETRLGVYTKYSMTESEPHVVPLCAADEETAAARTASGVGPLCWSSAALCRNCSGV